MKRKQISRVLACSLVASILPCNGQGYITVKAEGNLSLKAATEAFGATPTKQQLSYQAEELTAFIHFGINTFTGNEWGNGTENPDLFNPTDLDADQWIKTLKDAGFKRAILTAKHHDGFTLWPTATTNHSVASSTWKNGEGDVVKEMAEACKKYGLKFGVYLSPWDQNSADYGEGRGRDYNEFYMEQLTELLTNYGDIAEVWMDGAKGSNVQQNYKFDEWFSLIKKLQPNCIIFGPPGPDVRWIGNENGYAGEPCWSTIDKVKMIEKESPSYLNTGEEGGADWIVGESDVSIRPGWFYHENQDNSVKSLNKMMDIYFKSVGRNSVLLLNLPPNKEGKLQANDVARMKEFGDTVRAVQDEDLAANKTIKANSFVNDTFSADKILDNDLETYWAPNNAEKTGSFEINLGKMTEFDVISIQEYIKLGQRVAEFKIEISKDGKNWTEAATGKTIGYKRYIRMVPTQAQYIRVTVDRALATPLINNVSVYKSPENIELPLEAPEGLRVLNNANIGIGLEQFEFSSGWNYETAHSEDLGGDAHWSTNKDATVKIRFKGTKFYLSAAKDGGHGIMEVAIDGGNPQDVDLYAESRQPKQIIFESGNLEDTEHVAIVKVTGRKNSNSRGIAGHIDAALVLNNGGKGLLEFEKVSYNVREDAGNPQFKVKRKGGSNGTVEVNYDTIPGTAEAAKDFVRWSGTLSFGPGETEKIIDMIRIIDDEELEETKNFSIKLSDPIGGAVIGYNQRSTVNITHNDSEADKVLKIETTQRGDGLHQFNFKSGWNFESGGAWTRGEGLSYSIKFKGNNIKLVGAKDPNHGLLLVSIDGGEDIEVDPYAQNRLTEQVIFETTGLKYGEHTITVSLKGTNPHGGRADGQINYALVDTKDTTEPEVILGDLNNDAVVNIGDLALASKYYGQNKLEYDMNADAIIDEFELNTISNIILGL